MKWMRKHVMYLMLFVMTLAMVQFHGKMDVSAAGKVRLDVKSGDITDELQAALNDARDNKSGMYTIEIPAGTYQIEGPLKMYSNTCLSMKGVTLKRTNGNVMLRLGLEPDGSFGYSGYGAFKNIRLEGGTWDGSNKTASIIRLGHAQNITIEGVTIKNVKNNHHMEMAAVKNVTVSGCTFKNFTGDWKSVTNYEALQFDVIHQPSQFSKYDNYDDTPCQNVTVTKCKFEHVNRGVGTHSAVTGSYFTNMVFTDNTFNDVAGYAIICSNYKNAKINNNKMTNCGSGIWFRTMAQNHKMFFTPHKKSGKIEKNMKSEIKNNQIDATVNGYKNVVYGISLYGEVLTKNAEDVKKGDYRLEGVTVQNNKITLSCRGYGIWLQGACKNKVIGNTIVCDIKKKSLSSGGNGDGIRILDGTGNTVQKNVITNKVKKGEAKNMTGIYIENSDSTKLISNTVTGCSKDGISVKKSKKAELTGNKSNSNDRYGIGIENSDNAVLQKNSAAKSGKDGICVQKSKNVILKGNNCSANKRYGIRVTDNSRATAAGNITSKNKQKEIMVNNGAQVKGKL